MAGTKVVKLVRWVLTAAVVASLSTTVAAQTAPAASAPTEAEVAEARRIFQVGLAHADRGEWEDAVVSFRQVLEVRQAPPVLYNLGAALVALNQYPEAETYLRRVVDDAAADPALVTRAQAAMTTMVEHGGRATITLAETTPTTIVYLDGAVLPREQLGVEIPLFASAHEIVVRDQGTERMRRSFTIAVGDRAEIALVRVPGAAAVAEQAAPETRAASDSARTRGPSPERRRRLLRNPWLWTGVGAGVVLITVIGVVAGGTSDPASGNFNPPLVRF